MMVRIKLPAATSSIVNDPSFVSIEGKLTVQYLAANELESVKDVSLIFRDVLAYRFTESICADYWHEVDPHYMFAYDSSIWLDSAISKWDRAVGFHTYQLDRGGSARFRHFIIDFDDVGVFETLAGEFKISAG